MSLQNSDGRGCRLYTILIRGRGVGGIRKVIVVSVAELWHQDFLFVLVILSFSGIF